jgi:predicted GNAT family N-acyltransferase
LPSLPAADARIDPDRWLQSSDGWRVVHTKIARVLVSVDSRLYSISHALANQAVALSVDAAQQALLVLQYEQPLKSLHHQLCSFDDSVQRMAAKTRAQQHPLTWQQRRRWLVSYNSL